MKMPLLPRALMAYSSSSVKLEYSLAERSQEPLFSGLVDQFVPLRPTMTPSSTVQPPPCIATQPERSRPLKRLFVAPAHRAEKQPAKVASASETVRKVFFMGGVVTGMGRVFQVK